WMSFRMTPMSKNVLWRFFRRPLIWTSALWRSPIFALMSSAPCGVRMVARALPGSGGSAARAPASAACLAAVPAARGPPPRAGAPAPAPGLHRPFGVRGLGVGAFGRGRRRCPRLFARASLLTGRSRLRRGGLGLRVLLLCGATLRRLGGRHLRFAEEKSVV